MLEATDEELRDALFLDAEASAGLYFNLGAITINDAYERFGEGDFSATPNYSAITPLIESARTCFALAKRLDPTLSDLDSAAARVERLAAVIEGQ